MIRLAESATRAVSARGRAASWRSTAFGDAAAHPGVRGQEDHLRVRAVFRLRQQVEATKSGLAPLSAITSTSDGPAGMSMAAPSRRWLTAFGFRDVSVARAKDFIHLRHRLGTEGEGGDGLAPPTLKMVLRRTAARRRDLIGNRRRRAEHHLLTAGDARRRRQHQHPWRTAALSRRECTVRRRR